MITKKWEVAWPEFTPFLAFDREIRSVICSTNAMARAGATVAAGLVGELKLNLA